MLPQETPKSQAPVVFNTDTTQRKAVCAGWELKALNLATIKKMQLIRHPAEEFQGVKPDSKEMIKAAVELFKMDSYANSATCPNNMNQTRSSQMSSENFKQGTAHHVDLGFIHGPDNLTDMLLVTDGATNKGKHVIEGRRRGKECYLLIVHAASREAWTFPLKNKNPPTSLIDSFLQKNGTAGSRNKITTHPDSVLACSNRFQQTCKSNGFELHGHTRDRN